MLWRALRSFRWRCAALITFYICLHDMTGNHLKICSSLKLAQKINKKKPFEYVRSLNRLNRHPYTSQSSS